MIVDQATGKILATEDVVVRPAGIYAGLPAGTLLYSVAEMDDGWTDTPPR